VRNGLLVSAVLVSLLALAVSMMPGDSADNAVAHETPTDSSPVAAPRTSLPSTSPSPTTASATPSAAASKTRQGKNPDPEPQGASSSKASDEPKPGKSEPATCTVEFDLVNQWPDGFQAGVTITTDEALDGWSVGFTFRDGQQVGQMWDANVSQDGTRVTATAADYNKSVAAHGTITFGFLASWQGKNSPPNAFKLNGHTCTKA